MQELERTRIGPFTLEHAVRPSDISADSLMRLLRPPLEAVAHLNRVTLDQAQTEAVIHGRTIALPEIAGGASRWDWWHSSDRESRPGLRWQRLISNGCCFSRGSCSFRKAELPRTFKGALVSRAVEVLERNVNDRPESIVPSLTRFERRLRIQL